MMEAVLESAKLGKLSVLAGAGVSLEPPSSACGWREFRDELLDALLRVVLTENSYDASWVQYVEQMKASGLSPEVVLDAIDSFAGPLGMSQLIVLCSALDLGQPNRTHMSIAALARNGHLRHVFTTNWDSFLERALEPQSVLMIVRGGGPGKLYVEGVPDTDRRLVYLHGSLRGRYVQGGLWRLGFQLDTEIEKELILRAGGHDLLIIGYSGADWDVLKALWTAVARHDTRLFWVHLPGHTVAPGVLRLHTDFPERVHLLAMDMNDMLAALCTALRIRPDATRQGHSTATIVSSRRQHLLTGIRNLGRFRSCLSLACCAAASGMWKQSWDWCSFARDIAYDNVTSSSEPLLQRASGAEALRLGVMCLACGGDLDTSHFYLQNLKPDLLAWASSTGMGAAVNGFVEYASTVIHLCSANLSAAREALSACAASFNLHAHMQTMSGEGRAAVHPMTLASFLQLQCLLHVLEDERQENGKEIEQRLIETGAYVRVNNNLWGHCCHLLNVANFYYKWNMRNDATLALTDCLRESQRYGLRECERIAWHNMHVIDGKSHDSGPVLAPVVDQESGFGAVPDVFCVSLSIRPPSEE